MVHITYIKRDRMMGTDLGTTRKEIKDVNTMIMLSGLTIDDTIYLTDEDDNESFDEYTIRRKAVDPDEGNLYIECVLKV